VDKNILYISYDGLTDPLGQSQILPYLVGLSKKGYNFTILSVEKRYKFTENKTIIQKICDDNNIDWQYIYYKKKPPILSSVLDIVKLKLKARKLHRQKQFNIVHSRSYMGSIVALMLKQKYGVRFLFDMRGFYPDERVDGGTWDLKKWHYNKVYKYFKIKEKQFLSEADAIVSLTHAGKKIMEQDWNIKNSISVIPCATDTNLFKPIETKTSEALTIGYLGSLGTWYMLPEMLSFFKVAQAKYPNIKFLILTPDQPKQVYEEAHNQKISSQNIFVKFAKRDELPALLSSFDIGLFFIKPSFSKQASSPVKQGELMSMGIPVVTNSGVGDTDEIIQKYNSGILINKFTESEYKKAVGEFESLLSWNKKDLRNGALDYFSLEKGINEYNKIYESFSL
jgi:glycosyltransferase involved in cell wall biosynthesis